MRLLDPFTNEMQEFNRDDEIPPYAILSHMWGQDEVSYRHWESLSSAEVGRKAGHKKIAYSCMQASCDGLQWIWIDTCCIDKSSSAEVSEAINSMFRWYRDAAVCYVYLGDVTIYQREDPAFESSFRKSRWFTRGWTLQELIAPKNVVFYSQDWYYIGTKADLCSLISSTTGIGENYLNGADLGLASISHRMSWASRRQTSRTEDIAYCLLGIFDVNMPVLYGEGSKAFQRLQEIIMRTWPEDHTLYAWGTLVDKASWLYPKDKPWADWSDSDEEPGLGLLASSPKDFEDSGLFVPTPCSSPFYRDPQFQAAHPTQLGGGKIQLELPIFPSGDNCIRQWHGQRFALVCKVWYALLFCGHADDFTGTVAIPIAIHSYLSGSRSREIVRWKDPRSSKPVGSKKPIIVEIPPPDTAQLSYIRFNQEHYEVVKAADGSELYIPHSKFGFDLGFPIE